MLIKDTKQVYRHQVEEYIGKNGTVKDVLDYLFGGYGEYDQRGADFIIRKWSGDDRTVLNRLNMFWAIPFTLLLSPFMYLKCGYVGWDTKSIAGRFILKATGHLKETR